MSAWYTIPSDIDLRLKRALFRAQFSTKISGFENRTKYCPYTVMITLDIFHVFECAIDGIPRIYRDESLFMDNFFMIADALTPNIIVKEK